MYRLIRASVWTWVRQTRSSWSRKMICVVMVFMNRIVCVSSFWPMTPPISNNTHSLKPKGSMFCYNHTLTLTNCTQIFTVYTTHDNGLDWLELQTDRVIGVPSPFFFSENTTGHSGLLLLSAGRQRTCLTPGTLLVWFDLGNPALSSWRNTCILTHAWYGKMWYH